MEDIMRLLAVLCLCAFGAYAQESGDDTADGSVESSEVNVASECNTCASDVETADVDVDVDSESAN